MLTSSRVMRSDLPSARRYAAYALGAIATDQAVVALGQMSRTGADWQERGAATKGLGFALRKNPKARSHLERALNDPDDFVKRKAREGLEGRTKIEF
jgi:HEAT repeat protein